MRRVNSLQILVLILCLCVTGTLVYLKPESEIRIRRTKLVQTLASIGDWQQTNVYPLDPIIVEELKLDDYVFQAYSREDMQIELYVGYYYSSMKVGAAHSPLVCYPGGGWQVSGRESNRLTVSGDQNLSLNYSSLVAENEGREDLVFYWYQAGVHTTSGTFLQKLLLLRNKFSGSSENNAFVRISTTLNGESLESGQSRLIAFVKDFYPEFVRYVEQP